MATESIPIIRFWQMELRVYLLPGYGPTQRPCGFYFSPMPFQYCVVEYLCGLGVNELSTM